MRIAFDVSQTCHQRAGCAWFADSLARALAEADGTHEILLYHHFDGWINKSTSEGTQIAHPRVSAPLNAMPYQPARELWKRVREHGATLPGRPDIVHANNFHAPPLATAKLVFTVYDLSFWAHPEFTTESNRLICQAGLLEALRNADGLVFISEFSRGEFQRLLPGYLEDSGKASCVIYPAARGVPAGAVPPAPENYWLAVGSLEPRKNYGTLLTALETYWKQSDSPKPLRICGGEGWMSDPLKARIADLEREGKVQHLRYVPDGELERLYAGAAGLIFPSLYEGFGLPAVEAMSKGCPVLCSSVASLPEIGGADAAAYARPDDPDAIAHILLEWERHPDRRLSQARRGLERAAAFSWKRSAQALLAFYRGLLEG
jgi:glycosyltransferase involved in cell wall biosynthesis